MADDFIEHINPVHSSQEVDPLDVHGNMRQPSRPNRTINGQILAVRRGSRHAHEKHVLDLSVGGEENTEIILRVPNGAYANLEGKRAILYIDE